MLSSIGIDKNGCEESLGYLGILQENSSSSSSPVKSLPNFTRFVRNWDLLFFYLIPCTRNKRVCIDLSCWIVQLHNVNKSHCAMKEKLYLKGLFHRLRALIALNCSLIFVTGNHFLFLFGKIYNGILQNLKKKCILYSFPNKFLLVLAVFIIGLLRERVCCLKILNCSTQDNKIWVWFQTIKLQLTTHENIVASHSLVASDKEI